MSNFGNSLGDIIYAFSQFEHEAGGFVHGMESNIRKVKSNHPETVITGLAGVFTSIAPVIMSVASKPTSFSTTNAAVTNATTSAATKAAADAAKIADLEAKLATAKIAELEAKLAAAQANAFAFNIAVSANGSNTHSNSSANSSARPA